jgi:hypothetical protein
LQPRGFVMIIFVSTLGFRNNSAYPTHLSLYGHKTPETLQTT